MQQPGTSSPPLDGSRATPASSTPSESRARLERQLDGFEHEPTAEELLRVEPDVDRLRSGLHAIYLDPSVKKGSRQRALALLRHAPGEATYAIYQALLDDPATTPAERRIIVVAYANTPGADAEPMLIAELAHQDVYTRAMAAKELGRLGTPGAREALEARVQVETAAPVRKKIGEALGRDIGALSGGGGGVQ